VVLDELQALLGGHFVADEDVGGAELAGEVEAMAAGGAGDDHGLGGAAADGAGENKEAEGAGALDDDGVAGLDAGFLDGVGGGGAAARCLDKDGRVDLGVNADEMAVLPEVDILGIAAVEVGGVLAAYGDAVGEAVGAEGRLFEHDARVAAAAHDAAFPHDAVAGLEGAAHEVGLFAADLMDTANAFVTEDDGEGGAGVASAPHVDVGAAAARGFDADADLAWGKGGKGELRHLQRLVELSEDGGAAFHGRLLGK